MTEYSTLSVDITTPLPSTTEDPILTDFDDWLEQEQIVWGFRRWHVILMFCSAFLTIVVCICCCCRFRIPRTKQEIEADYIRKKLTRKFRQQLKMIQNTEMDEMDLKKALDRIRTEFKSDTESIGHSEVFSVGSRPDSPLQSYRKASSIGMDIENLIDQKENDGGRLRSRFSSFMDSFRSIKRNRTPISIHV